MSFLEHIKTEIAEQKRKYGFHSVQLSMRDLEELIHHFERLDHEARVEYNNRLPVNQDLIRKHGICTQCGELYSHHLTEPIASCKCGSGEWNHLTPHMELQLKYTKALDKIKFFERWVEDTRQHEKVSIYPS